MAEEETVVREPERAKPECLACIATDIPRWLDTRAVRRAYVPSKFGEPDL